MTKIQKTNISERIISLFEALSANAPPFQTEWESQKFLARQREVVRELAKHQSSFRVRQFLTKVDDESIADSDIWVGLRRAMRYAPLWLVLCRRDAELEKLNTPS